MKPILSLTLITSRHLAIASTLALLCGANASAQSASASVSASAPAKSVALDAPPPLEVEAGPNTLKKPDLNNKNLPKADGETTLTQSSAQGKATQVEVKRGKNTYYAKPNEPVGSGMRGDVQNNPIRGTQWKVMEFNSASKKKPPVAPAAPAAPTTPAAKAAAASSASSKQAPPADNSLALPPVLETK